MPMAEMLQTAGANAAATPESADERLARHSRLYLCRCGNPVFFLNTQCLACGSALGYLPDEGRIAALDTGSQAGTWRADGRHEPLKACATRDSPAACNWMLFAANPKQHCIACRLNRTIPNLDDADNARYWRAIEGAKRRLVSQLVAMGLPVRSKVEEDPAAGV